jgi:hypothetical protein
MLKLSKRHAAITKAWLPLAGTWLMMAIEGPYLAALIARSPEPKENLAAFGIAYAIGLIMESPIIMMMAAAVRLVENRQSFKKLFNFHMTLNIIITFAMLSLAIPIVFDSLAQYILSLTEPIASLTKTSCLLLLPWPAAIGYRRFYQGILIKNGQSKLVAKGTMFRLTSLAAFGFALWYGSDLQGAYIGTATLSLGVVIEAIAVRFMARHARQAILNGKGFTASKKKPNDTHELSYRFIANFYYPLALTAMLGLMSGPLVTLAMNRARFPLESLAALPIVNGFTFIFRAIPLSFQEVIISFMSRSSAYYKPLRAYAVALTVSLSFIYLAIAATPLKQLWLIDLSGLSAALADFASPALLIMIFTPSFSLILSWQRAMCIHAQKTAAIKTTSIIEVLAIAFTLHVGIKVFNLIGIVAAASSLMIARAIAISYLGMRLKSIHP